VLYRNWQVPVTDSRQSYLFSLKVTLALLFIRSNIMIFILVFVVLFCLRFVQLQRCSLQGLKWVGTPGNAISAIWRSHAGVSAFFRGNARSRAERFFYRGRGFLPFHYLKITLFITPGSVTLILCLVCFTGSSWTYTGKTVTVVVVSHT